MLLNAPSRPLQPSTLLRRPMPARFAWLERLRRYLPPGSRIDRISRTAISAALQTLFAEMADGEGNGSLMKPPTKPGIEICGFAPLVLDGVEYPAGDYLVATGADARRLSSDLAELRALRSKRIRPECSAGAARASGKSGIPTAKAAGGRVDALGEPARRPEHWRTVAPMRRAPACCRRPRPSNKLSMLSSMMRECAAARRHACAARRGR